MQVRLLPPQPIHADVAQLARGACFRHKRLRVRLSPSAPNLFKLSWRKRQTLTVESRDDESSNLSGSTKLRGCGQIGLSRLTFNQESASSSLVIPAKNFWANA